MIRAPYNHDIAGNSSGCPSIYEVNGREYLVITVAGPGTMGCRGRGGEGLTDAAHAMARMIRANVLFIGSFELLGKLSRKLLRCPSRATPGTATLCPVFAKASAAIGNGGPDPGDSRRA